MNSGKKSHENDSFDEYHPFEYENAWKYANVSVRKKSEREKIKGFSYDACEACYNKTEGTLVHERGYRLKGRG